MILLTIVGARPQFIKAAPVCKALRAAGHHEFLVHTGQHYDDNMSAVFFREMQIPEPDCHLGVGSGSHGYQTGQMLMRIEGVLIKEKPDWVLVYGDTNSTLAGALAAAKFQIPLAHVEAGLRSFNRQMPEEYNRVLTDHCANMLFCPTETAVENLRKEGFTAIVNNGRLIKEFSSSLECAYPSPIVVNVGDTMYDAVLQFAEIAREKSRILQNLDLKPRQYLLATVHRPYNTDHEANLSSILTAFMELIETVVFPVHPRTRAKLDALDIRAKCPNLKLIDPIGYLDMLMLEQNARLILTDSGGMQKEAYFFKVPCITLRPETEWVETVAAGWNVLAGAVKNKITGAVEQQLNPPERHPAYYGDGKAAEKIARWLG
ncbi:MAG: UDP-N-acetyl glucosamine 2-epimerase [Desulfobacterales bacterium]|jgi:UDP-N-acetylglucosamine 2-epimerase|nr:UDP-N-acetyl glucosamine 2-epimerase [Desulfobacterales bacterium]